MRDQPDLLGLPGKTAIVTGAGSRGAGIGNGRAAAILLARAGARVAIVDVQRDAAEATLEHIRGEGGNAGVFVADVSDEDEVSDCVSAVVEEFGGVDILVNNVGVTGPPGDAVAVSAKTWDEVMRINVASMMLMAKNCIPIMATRGGGAIVNVSSIVGVAGGHPTLVYPTSKGAVISLTKAMAAHHGHQNIRVNSVAPGLVFTPLVEGDGMPDELRRQRREIASLPIEGTGWDVGSAVLFLASPAARWITGVVLAVDGGLSARIPIFSPAAAYREPVS